MIGEDHAHGLTASLAAAAVSALGILSFLLVGDWARRNSPYFSAFAIGILTVGVMLHLIPESFDYSEGAWKWILGAITVMVTLNVGLRILTPSQSEARTVAFGFASILPLAFHSLLDGAIYEVSFHEDTFTGLVSTFGLLLHEFPEGIIAFFLMREAGFSNVLSLVIGFFASSVTTVVGALLGALVLDYSIELPIGALMGITAGALIYIIVFHLGPHAAKTANNRTFLWAGIGVAIATIGVTINHAFVPHAH
ncbi:MAG: ZIP family metal transporter [Pseudomonadota bacterium]